jgi:hypothetical protein
MFCLKLTWSGSTSPLAIVSPTDRAIPPERWNVLVDDRETAVSQHAADFVQHESRILRVVENIAEQHRVEALISKRKMAAVVGKVIDPRGDAASYVQPDDRRAEHAAEMVGYETVAAADVEDVSLRW